MRGEASIGSETGLPVLYESAARGFWGWLLARSLGHVVNGSASRIAAKFSASKFKLRSGNRQSAAIVQALCLKTLKEIMPLKTVVQQMAAKIPIYQGLL